MTRTLLPLAALAALAGCSVEADTSLTLRPYGANVPTFSMTAPGVTWSTDARTWRGMNGVRVRFDCPGGGAAAGSVYGSDLYTDDSPVCGAGVHAGRISLAAGGVVVIEIRAGAASYAASTRYGVATNAYAAYDGSFVVL
jgi:hypothetical protein